MIFNNGDALCYHSKMHRHHYVFELHRVINIINNYDYNNYSTYMMDVIDIELEYKYFYEQQY